MGTVHYDAFISYRHLPLDMAAAQKLQKLLENYRPPKSTQNLQKTRITRLFLDNTELPTSGDLDDALHQALLHSEFLIVILSPDTVKSKWCMAEIRAFKEAHGGSISHILPVIISGEPSDVIPAELRTEKREVRLADGSVRCEDIEVEPLCCDIRADSPKKALKRLRTEFLRIAAPLLGCGYDDLYRRHERRQRKIFAAVLSISTVSLTAILLVISVFAYRSYVAEQQYKANLVDTYTQQGAQALLQNKSQEALTYYSSALNLNPDAQAAKTASLLLLQQTRWPHLIGSEPGRLAELYGWQDSAYGTLLAVSDDGTWEVHINETDLTFFNTQTQQAVPIERPTEVNPLCDSFSVEMFSYIDPEIAFTGKDRAAVSYGAYLYHYDLSTAKLIKKIDLADLFEVDAERSALQMAIYLWGNPDNGLLAVSQGAYTVILDMDVPSLNAMFSNYAYALNDVVFGANNQYALVYGNDVGIDLQNPGGYVEVYDAQDDLILKTTEAPSPAPISASFSPDGNRLLVWGSSTLQFWDIPDGIQYAPPLQRQRLECAAFGPDGTVIVDDGLGTLSHYELTGFSPVRGTGDALPKEQPEWDSRDNIYPIDGQYHLIRRPTHVILANKDDNALTRTDYIDGFINRMKYDAPNHLGYFWSDGETELYRLNVETETESLGAMEQLNTRGWNITDLYPVADGMVAATGNGYLLYYKHGSTVPDRTLQLGKNGIVKNMAHNRNGLLAVTVKSTRFADLQTYHFSNDYTVELWDLNMGVRIADLEENNSYEPKQMALTDDGWLVYEKDGDPVQWLVDIGTPDRQTVSLLQSLSCLALDSSQTLWLQEPRIDAALSGSWGEALTEFHDGETDVETVSENASTQKQGDPYTKENLLARIDERLSDPSPSLIAQYRFVLFLQNFMLRTADYDDIIIDYYQKAAAQAEAKIGTEAFTELDLAELYESRVYAALLKGEGKEIFAAAAAGIDPEYIEFFLTQTPIGAIPAMMEHDPETAAALIEVTLEPYAEDRREQCDTLFITLREFDVLAMRGIISEQTLSDTVDLLPYTVGIELTQVNADDYKAGLRLNDIVTHINGLAFSAPYQTRALLKQNSSPSLTILRNGKELILEMPHTPKLSGYYDVK